MIKNGLFAGAVLLAGLVISGQADEIRAETIVETKCGASPFTGAWKNADKTEDFLIRLDVTNKCEKVITKPTNKNSPWAGSLGGEKPRIYRRYSIRPQGRCSPMNCVWGKSTGKINQKGYLTAKFRMFWSQRHLELIPENKSLRVRWRVQFIGRKKPDVLGEALLVRTD